MDTGVIVILLIAALLFLPIALVAGRRAKERRLEGRREEAQELRTDAEAQAHRADERASIAEEQAEHARRERAEAEEQARRADEVDPDVERDR
jgi:F0F1-type ATP synthase membrane subunit b/b'